jgi:MFS transporter, ACS family, tartrate transporter
VSGSTNLAVGLISTLPFCCALVSMLLFGWSSDRTGERRWHAALPMAIFGLGFLLSVLLRSSPMITVSMYCLAASGLGYLPAFWSLPTSFLAGTAAAASIGLINSVGNLGGFAGPFIVGRLNTATGSFVGGVLALALAAIGGAVMILAMRKGKR